jgi:hypothetical protein
MSLNVILEVPPDVTTAVAIAVYPLIAKGALVVIELLVDEAAEVPFALPAVTVNV